MRRIVLIASLLLGMGAALAAGLWPVQARAEWVRLTGEAEIVAALAGRVVIYDAWTAQSFEVTGARRGETLHVTDRAASGLWEVRDGRYCSNWPPSGTWTCYDLEVQGNAIRFLSDRGTISVGRYAE